MLDQLTGTHRLLSSWPGIPISLALLSLFVWLLSRPSSGGKEPASLPEWIPGISNAYRFVFHNMEFMKYARDNLKGRTILKFWLGPKGVYLITGAKNAQSVLRNSGNLSSDELFFMAISQLDSVEKQDTAQFRADKSGRSHIPLSDVVGSKGRIWEPNHKIFVDNLTPSHSVAVMTDKFLSLFYETIARFPGPAKSARLYRFLQGEMARCAIISLAGEEILKQNPDLIQAMWKFDSGIFPLAFGVPRLFYRKAYVARDAFHEMGEKFLKAAWEKFDWSGPEAETDWEPIFGSRFHRTHAKFLKDRGFAWRSRSGMELGTIWALNANTVPVTTWALIEIIKDKSLFEAVRAEASTALDPLSKEKRLDVKKLRELPLLQSIYTEALRIHVAINVTRSIEEDMTLDGYILKKGYLVQTPSVLSHFDESIWSDPGHPASEFWAERHITQIEKVDKSGNKTTVPQFSMAGRSGGFFPFGGGISICPGRHFAKQEIMAVIALIVLNFDIELEEYVKMDGSKSDRGPQDDPWYCGTAAMPPDRDLQIRLTKI